MSNESYQLIAASYGTYEQGDTILKTIQAMKKGRTIQIADAAMIMETDDGKFEVTETKELTARKGARRGAVIMGTLGLIFPPSFIASILVGGGLGALSGKLRDTGIKTDELDRLAQSLEPGQVAVLVLAHADSVRKVTRALQGYQGMIVTEPIDANATATLAESPSVPSESPNVEG